MIPFLGVSLLDPQLPFHIRENISPQEAEGLYHWTLASIKSGILIEQVLPQHLPKEIKLCNTMCYRHQGGISREWEGHTFQRHKWVRGKAGVSPASSELRFFLGWGREMSSPDTRSQEENSEE